MLETFGGLSQKSIDFHNLYSVSGSIIFWLFIAPVNRILIILSRIHNHTALVFRRMSCTYNWQKLSFPFCFDRHRKVRMYSRTRIRQHNNIIFFDRFFLFLGITRPKTSFADKNQRKLAAWCHSRVGFANYEENLLPKKSTALQRAASGLKRRDESSWTEQIPHCLEIVNFSITAVAASMKTAESGRRGKSKNQTNVDTRSMEEARLNYPEIPGKIFVLVHDLFENVPIWSNTYVPTKTKHLKMKRNFSRFWRETSWMAFWLKLDYVLLQFFWFKLE